MKKSHKPRSMTSLKTIPDKNMHVADSEEFANSEPCITETIQYDPDKCRSETATELDQSTTSLPKWAHVWTKSRDFIGLPGCRDFRLTTVPIKELKPNEILVEALYWSVQNYMRDFDVKLGTPMIGEQVGCIIASRHKDYPVWSMVMCSAGWCSRCVINPNVKPVRTINNIGSFPASVYLGPLGLPGLCAYFGFLEICRPKPGDTVLVNAAAGPVGSIVGQLAKHIIGCTVIAFASSKDRCSWIRELGFDYVYFKSVTVSAALARQAPNGVDCFFDCVGAEFTQGVVQHMKPSGTIVMCGYNSCYGRRINMDEQSRSDPYRMVCMQGAKIQTCSLNDFKPKWGEAEARLFDWMVQGKIKSKERILEGFDQLPSALTALYDDASVGNVIVQSTDIDSFSLANTVPNSQF